MTEERFNRCVVETVAPTGHGLDQSEVANESLVTRMGVVEACGDRQIDVLAGGDGEIGDIGHEYLPGLALPEFAVQSVRHDAMLVRRPRELAIRVHPPDFSHDVKFAHQSENPFMVDRETEGGEHLHVQPPIADFAFMAIMDALEKCRI